MQIEGTNISMATFLPFRLFLFFIVHHTLLLRSKQAILLLFTLGWSSLHFDLVFHLRPFELVRVALRFQHVLPTAHEIRPGL